MKTEGKSLLEHKSINRSPCIKQVRFLKITIFLLISILVTTSFSFSRKMDFGSKIEPISSKDVHNNQISIPEKGKVNVLLFFNINNTSHHKLVFEFNSIFKNLVDQDKKVDLLYISKGEQEKFNGLSKKYNLKFRMVNDIDEKFHSIFDYTCGICYKIIIIDKGGKPQVQCTILRFVLY